MTFEDVEHDEATPTAGLLLMVAGGAHVVSSIAHAGLFSLGFGIAALDPELNSDPTVLGAVAGAMMCFLLPDVVSLGLGCLAGLMGYQARRNGANNIAMFAAVAGVIWPLCRVAFDVLTCQCSTMFLYMLPTLASAIAILYIKRGE